MWSRKDLKTRGKIAFNRNYWKTVLIAGVLALIIGGGNYTYSFSIKNVFSGNYESSNDYDNDVDFDIDFEEYDDIDDMDGIIGAITAEDENFNQLDKSAIMVAFAIFGILFVIIFLVVTAIAIVIDAFVFNPIEVGMRRFGIVNLNTEANVKEVGFGFDNCYKNIVNTMFFRDLYTFLWSLLFVIPGIVKAYEYRMIPYLLAEHPEMTKEEAFATSKQMMHGQKWRTFVLDLSFIGWDILSACTLGILSVFYVEPYKFMTKAALYERLSMANMQTNSYAGNVENNGVNTEV